MTAASVTRARPQPGGSTRSAKAIAPTSSIVRCYGDRRSGPSLGARVSCGRGPRCQLGLGATELDLNGAEAPFLDGGLIDAGCGLDQHHRILDSRGSLER